tara:strand:+ start:147 stop:563 length:417 start_codon:yes stop_codon:yes gene_type:complete
MSTIAKDLDPDTFIGISLPLVHGTQGFFNKTKTTLEQTKSNIKNLLLTVRGERIGNPTFGSDLKRILFEPDAGDLGDKIEETIRASMGEWLPFVRIKSIKTTSSERNPNLLNVKLQFTINVDQNVETIDLDLTANGGA